MAFSKHLLVIRLSAMGDVAMTVPVIKTLSEKYPGLKITFLTRSFFTPLFEDLPNVEVFVAEVGGRHKGFFGIKRLSEKLAAFKPDAVADLHNVLRSNLLKFFFKLKGIPVKQLDKARSEKKALTQPVKKNFKPLKSTHQRYADVFAELGYPINLSEFKFLRRKQLTSNIQDLAGGKQEKWLGIAPFAQHDSKAYPHDLMLEVLQGLQKGQNLKLFFFGGGKKETGILKHWEKKFPNAISVAGKLSFQEELTLISNLDAMLSMDSGNGHLAANYGVPVITLWGLTHPYTGFAPIGQPSENWLLPDLKKYPAIPTSIYGNKIPKGYEDAMGSISPEEVVGKVEFVLDL